MSQPFGGLPPAPQQAAEWRLPERGAAPASVRRAVWLMLLRSAIAVVSVIVMFAQRDELKRRILEKTPGASNGTVNATLTTAAVFGIVVLVFYVFLAFQVRNGVNWARIVTWVIAGLGILGALVSLNQPDPPLSQVFGVIAALIDVAVVILLAVGDSNRYFRTPEQAPLR